MRFPPPPACQQSGFSLLEVIAAVMLLAIAFTALIRVAGSSLNLTTNAAQRSEAAMVARSVLDSAFVLEPTRPGSTSGRFDQQFRWQLDVAPWNPAGAAKPAATPEPEASLRIYQLNLDVLWGNDRHPRQAHFSTLRLAVGGPTAAAGSR